MCIQELSLEQVDELSGLVDKAWKSKSVRPVVSFREAQAEDDGKGQTLLQLSIAQSEGRAIHVHEKPIVSHDK